jgi:hypothetical protein
VPVQPALVRPNEEVRVIITDQAATRVARELGTFTSRLDGQLAPLGSDSIAISVLIARGYQGTALEGVRQTLAVQRGEVAEVRRRQFSRKYSLLTAAAVVTGFVILVNSLTQQEDPNIPPGNIDVPPPEGVRGFRIPIGWNP